LKIIQQKKAEEQKVKGILKSSKKNIDDDENEGGMNLADLIMQKL